MTRTHSDMLCRCSVPAAVLVWKTIDEDTGRLYYACPKDMNDIDGGCEFFLWKTAFDRQPVTCSRCRRPGHYARTCLVPEQDLSDDVRGGDGGSSYKRTNSSYYRVEAGGSGDEEKGEKTESTLEEMCVTGFAELKDKISGKVSMRSLLAWSKITEAIQAGDMTEEDVREQVDEVVGQPGASQKKDTELDLVQLTAIVIVLSRIVSEDEMTEDNAAYAGTAMAGVSAF